MRNMTSLLAVFAGMIMLADVQTKNAKTSGTIKDGTQKILNQPLFLYSKPHSPIYPWTAYNKINPDADSTNLNRAGGAN